MYSGKSLNGLESLLFPAFDYKSIKKSSVDSAERITVKLNPDHQQSSYRTISDDCF